MFAKYSNCGQLAFSRSYGAANGQLARPEVEKMAAKG
jgi:hypothetical protein